MQFSKKEFDFSNLILQNSFNESGELLSNVFCESSFANVSIDSVVTKHGPMIPSEEIRDIMKNIDFSTNNWVLKPERKIGLE